MSHGDTKRGKVYVASMNMRGKWATAPPSLKLNVTSAQSVTSKNRAAFSPMTEIPDGFDPTKPMAPREEKYHCFENWWQSLKKIEGVDHVQSNQWWRKQTAPHRRFPNSKDKRKLYSLYKGTQYNYVDSRKNIYVPQYHKYIHTRKNSLESLKYYSDQLDAGKDVTVFDFDGPRLPDKGVTCLEVSKELLVDKINDTETPFGHGYVVAATLAQIPMSEYVFHNIE